MAKKEKKPKKEKRSKKEKKPKARRFAYDTAVSALGALVCVFAGASILAIALSVVYAILFMT